MQPAGLDIELLAFIRARFFGIAEFLHGFLNQEEGRGSVGWRRNGVGGIRGAGTVPTCVCDVSFVPTAGSYVALTVQGRPPGSPQIPLADSDVDLAAFGHMSPIMASPHSPGTSGNAERITSPVLMGVRLELSFQKEKWSWVVLIFF